MKKIDVNVNVLSDAELDSMMLLLEAAYSNTGDNRIFQVLDILMHDNNQLIKQHADNNTS